LSRSIRARDVKATREGRRRANFLEQLLAPFSRQALGVVDALGNSLGVEDDGGRDNGTCQGPATGLVAARDRPDAALERITLARKGRANVVVAERQAGGGAGGGATHRARYCAPIASSQ